MLQAISLSEVDDSHPVSVMARYFAAMPREICPLAPLWSDFDPMAVPRALAWTILIRREDPTSSGHVVRLMGEGAINLYSANLTGMTIMQAYERGFVSDRWQNLAEVTDTRQATFHRGNVPREERKFIRIYRGCFPFCDEKRDITRLLVVIAPIDKTVSEYWGLQEHSAKPGLDLA